MVKLVVGRKGVGKTKIMIDLANESIETSDGSVIFLNKDPKLMYSLKHKIRFVCLDEYEDLTNSDEYIGFLYGIISSDHDIEVIFIDSLLKQADITIEDLPEMLERLDNISKKYDMEFVVSLSADIAELSEVIPKYQVLND